MFWVCLLIWENLLFSAFLLFWGIYVSVGISIISKKKKDVPIALGISNAFGMYCSRGISICFGHTYFRSLYVCRNIA